VVGVCRLGGGGVKKLKTNATCTAVTVIRHGLTDTRKFLFIFSQCLKYVLRCSLTSTKSLATSSNDTDLSCSIVNGIPCPPCTPA